MEWEDWGEAKGSWCLQKGMKRVEEDAAGMEWERNDATHTRAGCPGRSSVWTMGAGGGGVDPRPLPNPDLKVPAHPETVLDFGTPLLYTPLQIISSRIIAQKCAPYSIPASFNYLHLLHLQAGPHLRTAWVLVHKSLVLQNTFSRLASLSVPLDTGPHLLKLYCTWLSDPTIKKEPRTLISNTPILLTASGQHSPIISYIICRQEFKIVTRIQQMLNKYEMMSKLN